MIAVVSYIHIKETDRMRYRLANKFILTDKYVGKLKELHTCT